MGAENGEMRQGNDAINGFTIDNPPIQWTLKKTMMPSTALPNQLMMQTVFLLKLVVKKVVKKNIL